jgi:hypothetical protein
VARTGGNPPRWGSRRQRDALRARGEVPGASRGRRIDDREHTSERADWLLPDHRLIVEIKTLDDDRVAQVQRVIDRWSSTFLLAYGEHPFQRLIRNHPYRDQINAEICRAAMKSVERAFRKANSQLETTRQMQGVPDWYGAVFFVIEKVYFFDPAALKYEIGRLFAKRWPDGTMQFPEIDWVFIPTAAHTYVHADGIESAPVLSWVPPTTPRRDGLEALANLFTETWAAFHGVPLLRPTDEEIARMQVRSKTTPDLKFY